MKISLGLLTVALSTIQSPVTHLPEVKTIPQKKQITWHSVNQPVQHISRRIPSIKLPGKVIPSATMPGEGTSSKPIQVIQKPTPTAQPVRRPLRRLFRGRNQQPKPRVGGPPVIVEWKEEILPSIPVDKKEGDSTAKESSAKGEPKKMPSASQDIQPQTGEAPQSFTHTAKKVSPEGTRFMNRRITGRLYYLEKEMLWVLRLKDTTGTNISSNRVVLSTAVDLGSFNNGDVVTVRGELLDQINAVEVFGSPLYRAYEVNLVERAER